MIYCSPSLNHEEFENLGVNFVLLLWNINNELPICSIVTGYFNPGTSNWCKKILPTQHVRNFALSCYQLNIHKLLINLLIL